MTGSSDTSRTGSRSLKVSGSQPAGQGWPGWQTTDTIPIDPTKKYRLTANYYLPLPATGVYPGVAYLDIQIFNSQVNSGGSISGAVSVSSAPSVPGTWLSRSLTLDPGTLRTTFPDIAAVKLGLRLYLDTGAGIPENTMTTVYYDDISFAVIGEASPAPVVSTPRYGGVLRGVLSRDPYFSGADLNPYGRVNGTKLMVNSLLFNTLVRYEPQPGVDPALWELRPDLLESWELSGDGTAWIMALRKDVLFHDGTLLTASDVATSMEEMIGSSLTTFDRMRADLAGLEVLDDFTVKVSFSRPYPSLYLGLGV